MNSKTLDCDFCIEITIEDSAPAQDLAKKTMIENLDTKIEKIFDELDKQRREKRLRKLKAAELEEIFSNKPLETIYRLLNIANNMSPSDCSEVKRILQKISPEAKNRIKDFMREDRNLNSAIKQQSYMYFHVGMAIPIKNRDIFEKFPILQKKYIEMEIEREAALALIRELEQQPKA